MGSERQGCTRFWAAFLSGSSADALIVAEGGKRRDGMDFAEREFCITWAKLLTHSRVQCSHLYCISDDSVSSMCMVFC